MKIINKIRSHYSRKSKLTLVFDILFYLFILLMIIPPTRKKVLSMILRVTLHQPIFSSASDSGSLNNEDLTWELISHSGERVAFSQLQDSVIFLNFWATWCPPCIAEMPGIQKLYDEFGDRVSFILVSQEPPSTVNNFLEKHGYSLPTHLPMFQTPEIFDHRSIPTTFIISRSGEVVMKHKGATKWDGKKIKTMLEKLIEE
jgi:thiol-disulfide isomerase/thioredoxin